MKVVVQRVKSASVAVEGKIVGKIVNGLVLLICVAETDTKDNVESIANKCTNLRIFQDNQGKLNRSLIDEKGEVLAISQFTLLGDTRKGRRPSFISAAHPEKGKEYYEYFIDCIVKQGVNVETGIFGAMMDVELINTGPVTLIVESKYE